jgi:hypothetical protein
MLWLVQFLVQPYVTWNISINLTERCENIWLVWGTPCLVSSSLLFESDILWQQRKRRNPSYSSLFPVLFYYLFLCLNRHLTHNLDQTFKVCAMSCVSHVFASIAFLAGVKQEAEYKYEYGPFAGMLPSLHTSVDSFLHGVNGDAVIRWENMHSKLASCRRGGAPRRVCQP